MGKIAVVSVSAQGLQCAEQVAAGIPGTHIYTLKASGGYPTLPRNSEELSSFYAGIEGLIFVGALGICVRTVFPWLQDKHRDPAVVCVDSGGRYAIAVASGHVGGANALARRVSGVLGAEPIITTQSDGQGLWSLDLLAAQYGWQQETRGATLNTIIGLYVDRQPTLLLLEARDRGTDALENSLAAHVEVVYSLKGKDLSGYKLLIAVTPRVYDSVCLPTLYYHPSMLWLGVGCRREADPAGVSQAITKGLQSAGYSPLSVRGIATIDVKAEEPLLQALGRSFGVPVRAFSAEALKGEPVPNPSLRVAKAVSTPSVAEAAALHASGASSLLIEKRKGKETEGSDYTYALAEDAGCGRHGHVEIVGAGPGDVDLITLRGRAFIARADLLLYAGSLVSGEHARYVKPGAVVRSSAGMSLEAQFALMKEYYDAGKLVVRLHTGDPSIYGAIGEQMALFDQHGMSYHITPGVSSFQAAAAALKSQFTIPGGTQTIVLTRDSGRTKTQPRERLSALAQSQSTMCIFLSAGMAESVQAQLLEGYPPETPVAVCHRLTWPDERVDCGHLEDLATLVKAQGSSLTTLLVVGEAVGNRRGASKLYDGGFSHIFRQAER